MIRPDGTLVRCSRLAVGEYGLLGAVYAVTLRLVARHVLERVVEVRSVDELMDGFAERIAAGFTYEDSQFAIDPASPDFLRTGVLPWYRPVPEDTVPAGQRALGAEDWMSLLTLAHTDKSWVFEVYAAHYRATSGQRYWSDDHQFVTYLDGYHAALDQVLKARGARTEMITELAVPGTLFEPFLATLAGELRAEPP